VVAIAAVPFMVFALLLMLISAVAWFNRRAVAPLIAQKEAVE
jgi:hypothetical protein